jgi:hypothetical protein
VANQKTPFHHDVLRLNASIPPLFCSRSSDSEDTYTTTYSSSSSSSSRIIGRFFVFFYARLIVAKIHIENKLDVIRRMIIRNNNSVLLENHFLNWVFEKILLQYGLVRNILWALTTSTKDACKEPCIRTKGTTKRSITIQKLLITIKHETKTNHETKTPQMKQIIINV